jgi:hypothetical protein
MIKYRRKPKQTTEDKPKEAKMQKVRLIDKRAGGASSVVMFIYKATPSLLKHMGMEKLTEMEISTAEAARSLKARCGSMYREGFMWAELCVLNGGKVKVEVIDE